MELIFLTHFYFTLLLKTLFIWGHKGIDRMGDNDTVSSKHADGLVTFFSIRNGECIVSMIELPVRKNPKQNATQGIKQERNGHCYGAVTIIIRDAHGKYAWTGYRQQATEDKNGKLLLLKQTEKNDTAKDEKESKEKSKEESQKEKDETEKEKDEYINEMEMDFIIDSQYTKDEEDNKDIQNEDEYNALLLLLSAQDAYDNNNENDNNNNADMNAKSSLVSSIHPCVPLPTTINSGGTTPCFNKKEQEQEEKEEKEKKDEKEEDTRCSFVHGRSLLSHLGLISLESWSDITMLKTEDKLHHAIQKLDGMSSRDRMNIDVTYIKEDRERNIHLKNNSAVVHASNLIQKKKKTDNKYVSSLIEFHAFLTSLGWPEAEYLPPDLDSDDETEEVDEYGMKSKEFVDEKNEKATNPTKKSIDNDNILEAKALKQGGISASQLKKLKRGTIGMHRLTGSMRFREDVIRKKRTESTTKMEAHDSFNSSKNRTRSRTRSRTKSSGDSYNNNKFKNRGRGELQHTGFHHVMAIRVPCWNQLNTCLSNDTQETIHCTLIQQEEEEDNNNNKDKLESETQSASTPSAAPVRVVWNDSSSRAIPGTKAWATNTNNLAPSDMTIVIDPITDQPTLCAVRIYLSQRLLQSAKLSAIYRSRPGTNPTNTDTDDNKAPLLGPLLDGMVVRLHLLATLVRSTAINVHRWLEPTLALSKTNSSSSLPELSTNNSMTKFNTFINPAIKVNSLNSSSLPGIFNTKRNSAGTLHRGMAEDRVKRESKTRTFSSSSLSADSFDQRRNVVDSVSSVASQRMIGSRSEPQIQRMKYIKKMTKEHAVEMNTVQNGLSTFFGGGYRQKKM